MKKLIRITTVPISLKTLLKGQHHFMSENGFEVIGVSSAGVELKDVAKNEHIRTISVEMSRKISPIKDLQALLRFYRVCKIEKPDIVHSHTPKAGIVGMLGSKLAGVPIRVHTVAGLPLMEAKGIKRHILNWVEKLTYACATQVYPNSHSLREFIIQQKFTDPEKLKVIGHGSSNGIDTHFFNPSALNDQDIVNLRKKLNISPDDYVFIFVGRIVRDKGINELVMAFNELDQPNTRLLLVGKQEPELDPLLPKTLHLINNNPDIITVGFQHDVRPYFGIADCLVFPSYREGFPNVVMQAAAMQLNAIVSDINGCNEIIQHGKNGWIVPPKQTDTLKEKMTWSLENREISRNMGIKSREIMKTYYEQNYIWQEILKEYQTMLNDV